MARLRLLVLGRVAQVVLALRRAGRGAAPGVEGSGGEDSDAHVGVLADAVEGRVDCGGVERGWRGVAGWGGDGGAGVAVAAGNDDVEVAAVLAVVGCGLGRERTAPGDAFGYDGGGGVGAGFRWVGVWRSLVRCKRVVAEVSLCLQGSRSK